MKKDKTKDKDKSKKEKSPNDLPTAANNDAQKLPYYNRELSWLDFNLRVLEAGQRPGTPIMEQLRFLAITGSNLDEFFMVRVAGVWENWQEKNIFKPDADGLSAEELYPMLADKIHDFTDKQYSCFTDSILPTLKNNGFSFATPDELDESGKKFIDNYFAKIVYPVLTPLAIDRSRPFPFLANRSLNIAVRLAPKQATPQKAAKDSDKGKNKKNVRGRDWSIAVLQVPNLLPRFVEVPSKGKKRVFVLSEEIIKQSLSRLFEAHDILATRFFRITRDSDLDLDDEGTENLMVEIEEYIRRRKRGRPIRLELSGKDGDKQIRSFLTEMLNIDEFGIYEHDGPLDLTFLSKFAGIKGAESLCFSPVVPLSPPLDFTGYEDIFAAIRERDRLVIHPYESFGIVLSFIRAAAEDENVLAIKQTLYRVSGNSPIVDSLIRAAELGKQVTVLVELKARFDEENNILWAKKLEKAGCHVVYGLSGLKIHCKIALVVRREEDGIRRYVHMATGNYNDATARIYTDMGLFTSREPFGIDASALFNVLTGYSLPPRYNKMIVAPSALREFFVTAINAEIDNARRNIKASITAKVNSLVDAEIVNLLYKASQAGVKIRLIVRGICCIIPKREKISENIEVVSLIGQFLEHSRIFRFENGGDPQIYLGSADWMPRNLDRRVELVFPVEDPELKKRVNNTLDLLLKDNVNAFSMQSDTTYQKINRRNTAPVNAQDATMFVGKVKRKKA